MAEEKQNLLQLYRFCFLMLANAAEAQEVFHAILREAAQLAAGSEAPRDRLWFFRNARWRCLEAGEQGLQAEDVDLKQDELAESAPSQIEKLEPQQFAIWISGAPEPQRTALALFYLDEFNYCRNCSVTGGDNSKPGWTRPCPRPKDECDPTFAKREDAGALRADS